MELVSGNLCNAAVVYRFYVSRSKAGQGKRGVGASRPLPLTCLRWEISWQRRAVEVRSRQTVLVIVPCHKICAFRLVVGHVIFVLGSTTCVFGWFVMR